MCDNQAAWEVLLAYLRTRKSIFYHMNLIMRENLILIIEILFKDDDKIVIDTR